ncbi:AraC family transcriptional regulator [Temperatibacter marinus]|uniref:AraC family transcriptional regulator n=1 Tax=Temperatibacter marinus TaxID=1456591 RepID=A0AA52EI40_9PROT|nr:AraC family transcriptional regulator [Temperatibacter marinus]WND02952.1 AraC family transcriptional regulator [Temperatibacter marinus]
MKNTDWIHLHSGDIPRMEACFSGQAYAPHRHDNYTIALTTHGVQSFNYRQEKRHSMAGDAVILHPDEKHDGMAGTDTSFGYRALTIDPEMLQDALDGRPLPFIQEGVVRKGAILDITRNLLGDLEHGLSVLEFEGFVYELAQALEKQGDKSSQKHTPNIQALKIIKDYLETHFLEELTLDHIAQVAGYSKWHLVRDFKTLFGSSPYQYIVYLRLCLSKELLLKGQKLVDTALDCKFSDQSHFTKKFKQRFGLTPKQWLTLIQHPSE